MPHKVDVDPHRLDLRDRVEVARKIVNATQSHLALAGGGAVKSPPTIDVSREVRGLAVVLLFAAYENLLSTLCRTLLESAGKSRAQARRLKPGIQLFLVHKELVSMMDSRKRRLWTKVGPNLISALAKRPASEINPDIFPDDGSFMKTSQIVVFCDVFDLGNPAPVMREMWVQINAVVDQRNAIAHGRETPEEVGRRYSHDEILSLINSWERRWLDFLDWVDAHCGQGPFYLNAR